MQHPEPNLEKAIAALDEIIEINPISVTSLSDAGHCHFKLGNKELARKMYEKAIRTANLCLDTKVEDELVFLRCGIIYNSLEMWEDGRVMFLMCAGEENKKSYAYFNLGVADYNLGLVDEAEKMFSHCNFMNPRNSETWIYLALTLLKKSTPEINAAY